MKQTDRATAIEDAAYRVLKAKGFKGTSMLAVAREAKASNETLYRWYGDKLGLFSAMIQRNTNTVEAELNAMRASGGKGLETLVAVGRKLLGMLTGERAVALNRAAASDVTGSLGKALAEGGRKRVVPQLRTLLYDTYGDAIDVDECVEAYIALLVGDLQIRRVTGALGPMSDKEVSKRAERAMRQFRSLYPPR